MAGINASEEVLALLAPAYGDSYKAQRKALAGVTTDGYGMVRAVRPAPGQAYNGSDIAIAVCEDGSKNRAFRDGKVLGSLGIRESIFYFKRVDGALKIWWQTSAKVPTC